MVTVISPIKILLDGRQISVFALLPPYSLSADSFITKLDDQYKLDDMVTVVSPIKNPGGTMWKNPL